MKQLTDRQREVIKLIYEGQREKGITPSLAELAKKLGVFSKQTVKDLLDAIGKKGFLKREHHCPRAITLKPEIVEEIEREKNYFDNMQQNLDFIYSDEKNNSIWETSECITINYGKISNLSKTIIDSSEIISLQSQNRTEEYNSYNRTQFVAEKSNFDGLYDTTQKYFIENYNVLIVTPKIPILDDTNGYTILDEHPLYEVIWSGSSSNHFFRFGQEYGNTEDINYIDNTGQFRLFSISRSKKAVKNFIKRMRLKLKSLSNCVDFPIYGGALKKSGEILYWSRRTDKDKNDLRIFFIVDITKTNIQSNDRILLRDISSNFPNLINNNFTNYVFSN